MPNINSERKLGQKLPKTTKKHITTIATSKEDFLYNFEFKIVYLETFSIP